MEFTARYQDGKVGDLRDVICIIDLASDPVMLAILDAGTREIIDRWPADESYLLHSRMMELRIANRQRPPGARLAVVGIENMKVALNVLPKLSEHQRRDGFRQVRTLTLATAALLSVIVAYLYGIPLLADRLVAFFPPEWEIKIGATADAQIEASITEGKGYTICETNPNTVANKAIMRFTELAFAGLNSPFAPTVTVIRSNTPNAFALPGGRTYYLSSLIQASRTSDEFAGVLAHELGHVYYRHGMQTLIATSTTGLLVGFVLGDMTGLSVAGAIGASLIDNRFSRQAEAQADDFAGKTAQRLGFSPQGLVELLDRVAKDDSFAKALALFSNHPLTAERRKALEAFDVEQSGLQPAFSDEEWQAIRNMCPPPPPPPLPAIVTPVESAS
jgi:Zn-dependent protease with chaperone function